MLSLRPENQEEAELRSDGRVGPQWRPPYVSGRIRVWGERHGGRPLHWWLLHHQEQVVTFTSSPASSLETFDANFSSKHTTFNQLIQRQQIVDCELHLYWSRFFKIWLRWLHICSSSNYRHLLNLITSSSSLGFSQVPGLAFSQDQHSGLPDSSRMPLTSLKLYRTYLQWKGKESYGGSNRNVWVWKKS